MSKPSAEDLLASLRVASLNCTSLRAQWDVVKALLANVDVLALQEVRLTSSGQRQFGLLLKKLGFQAVWGAPRVRRRRGLRVPPGGVAIFARMELKPRLVSPQSKEQSHFFNDGRLVHVALAVGGECVHVVSCYGFPNASVNTEMRAKNEDLLKASCAVMASIGRQPALLCGDLNVKPDASHTVTMHCGQGLLQDMAVLDATMRGTVPQPTCFPRPESPGTRIDYVLANGVAALAFRNFQVYSEAACCPRTAPWALSWPWPALVNTFASCVSPSPSPSNPWRLRTQRRRQRRRAYNPSSRNTSATGTRPCPGTTRTGH